MEMRSIFRKEPEAFLFHFSDIANVVARKGVLDIGGNFIRKPFSTKTSAKKDGRFRRLKPYAFAHQTFKTPPSRQAKVHTSLLYA